MSRSGNLRESEQERAEHKQEGVGGEAEYAQEGEKAEIELRGGESRV